MKHIVEPIKSLKDIKTIENYLAKNSSRNRLIFAFGINTGLRVSDILNLNVSDVLNKTHIEIKEKKTGKYKKFPINGKLQRLLKEYLNDVKNTDKPLFISRKGYRLHRNQVYRFLNDACRNVGININVGTHTMRKTFGFFFYKRFKDIALLQRILNHSSPSITLRYIGISQEEIDVSYNQFEL